MIPNIAVLINGKFKMFAIRGNRKDLKLIAQLADEGVLNPTIAVFPFEDYSSAFAQISQFKGKGKTVLFIE